MDEEIKGKPLIQATLGDMEILIRSILHMEAEENKVVDKQVPEYTYGIKGVGEFMGCSDTTVYRRIKEGKLDDAMFRNGRLLIFDTEKVMEVLKKEGWGMVNSKKGGKK